MTKSRIILTVSVVLFVITILSFLQIKLENPIILAERFYIGGGWIEIAFIALYAGMVAWNMHDPAKVPLWRKYTWILFSIVFFSQLIIGILGFPKFLMTGKLHLPIPMMILAGPVYRAQISFMTILFLSTVFLTGPAWCSHLCYFGAFDGYASARIKKGKKLKFLSQIKFPVLFLTLFMALIFRLLNVPVLTSTYFAAGFGILGAFIIIFISPKKGKMIHCISYCPIGTIVNYLKYVNPFRLKIKPSCDSCLRCTITCKYNALKKSDIENKKPGITCTLCGDCIHSCHTDALQYNFFQASGKNARLVYLFLTISLHAVFMALARI